MYWFVGSDRDRRLCSDRRRRFSSNSGPRRGSSPIHSRRSRIASCSTDTRCPWHAVRGHASGRSSYWSGPANPSRGARTLVALRASSRVYRRSVSGNCGSRSRGRLKKKKDFTSEQDFTGEAEFKWRSRNLAGPLIALRQHQTRPKATHKYRKNEVINIRKEKGE